MQNGSSAAGDSARSFPYFRLETLDAQALAPIHFGDSSHALELILSLSGHGVPDEAFERLLNPLLGILSKSPAPDRALVNFGAWLEGVGSRTTYFNLLAQQPATLEALATILGASQFLAGLLLKNPEYFEVIANPTIRDRKRRMEDFLDDAHRRISVAKTPPAKRDALRRFKPPEILIYWVSPASPKQSPRYRISPRRAFARQLRSLKRKIGLR
jgi:glutamine synthetase adenylyltransferase